jgi:hypothetical protein
METILPIEGGKQAGKQVGAAVSFSIQRKN